MSNISFDYLDDEHEATRFSTNNVNFKMPSDDMHDLLKQIFGDIDENSKNYQKCLELINNGLHLVPANIELMVHKIKYLVLMNQLDEAEDVDEQINKQHGKILNVFDAFFSYYECNFDKCDFERIGNNLNIKIVEEMMIRTLEFKRSLIFANSEINAKNYSEAVSILHDLDNCDDTNRKAYLKICKMLLDCYTKMSNQDDNIIKYASEILKENPLDMNMLITRADSYKQIKNFKFAENDLKAVLKFENLSIDDQMRVQDLLKKIEVLLGKDNVRKINVEHEKQQSENTNSENNSTEKSEDLNDKGNIQLKSNQYKNAIQYYSEAIQLCPKVAKYYTNRSFCHSTMGNYECALNDAKKAIEVDPSFSKGYFHVINSLITLGNIDQAQIYITKMQEKIDDKEWKQFEGLSKFNRLISLDAKIAKLLSEENFEKCLKQLEKAFEIATSCKQYAYWMAECQIKMKIFDKAEILIAKHPRETYAIYLDGLIAFSSGNYEMSVKRFQEALRLDPDFKKALNYLNLVNDLKLGEMKQNNNKSTHEDDPFRYNITKSKGFNYEGNLKFKSDQFADAIQEYSKAIQLCPQVAKYYTNRSTCHLAIGNCESAMHDALKAIEVEPSFSKGYFHAINSSIILGKCIQAKYYIKIMQQQVAEEEWINFNGIFNVSRLEILDEKIVKSLNEQNFEECLYHLERALQIASSCKQYLFWMAECQINLKSYEKAKLLIAKHQKEAYAIYLEGLIAFSSRDYLVSVERFQEALNLEPDLKKALHYKELAEGLNQKQSFHSFSNLTKKSEELNEQGNIQFKSKNYVYAIHYYSDAIKLCPNEANFYTNRSSCYLAMGNYESALHDAVLANNIDPLCTKGYFQIITSCINLGDIHQAQTYITKMQKNIHLEEWKNFDGILKVERLMVLDDQIVKFLNEENFEQCLKYLESALEMATSCMQYHFWIAECQIKMKSYDKAQILIAKHPGEAYAIYLEGLIAFSFGELKKSSERFQEAINLNPSLKNAIKYKNLTEDMQRKQQSQLNPEKEQDKKEKILKQKSQDINEQGNIHLKSNRYNEAIRCYSEAIKLCPHVVEYYTNRSFCYMSLTNYECALDDAKKAIDIEPSFSKGYFHAINAFINLGNIDQAQIYIKEMQANVTDEEIKNFDGIPKVQKLESLHETFLKFWDGENFEECLKHLEDALEIATACKQYVFWLAECLIKTERYEKAEKLILQHRKEPYAIFLDGLVAFYRKNYVLSIDRFQEALNLNPDLQKALKFKNLAEELRTIQSDQENANKEEAKKKEIFNNSTKKSEEFNQRGNIQFKSNQYANAIHYYSDAIQLCPQVVKYYTNRCSSYMAMSNFECALNDAMKAIEIEPSFWRGYSHAINAFINLGNIDQAQIYIKKMQNNVTDEAKKFDGISKVQKLVTLHEEILKFWDEKKFVDCLKHLEEAQKIATACKQYEFWMAESLINLKKYSEANEIIAKNPKDPYAIFLDGLVAFNHKNYAFSIDRFQEAIKLSPEFKKAIKYKNLAKDLEKKYGSNEQQEGCDINLINKAEDLIEQGNIQLRTNNSIKAIHFFSEAIRLRPKEAKYYTNRSFCHLALGNFEFALDDALNAINFDPSFWKGYSHAINAFINLGNIDQAQFYIKQMQGKIHGDDWKNFDGILRVKRLLSLHKKIETLLNEEKFELCLKYLEDAFEIATSSKQYLFWMAECLINTKRHVRAELLISKYPKEPYIVYLEGLIAFNKREYDLSIERFQEALRLDPAFEKALKYKHLADLKKTEIMQKYTNFDNTKTKPNTSRNSTPNSEAINGKGNIQFRSKHYENAIQDYSDAIKLCPQVVKYYTNRSRCYLEIKNYDKAILDALEAIKIDPSFSKGYFHAINAFITLGNFDHAQMYIKKMKKNVDEEEWRNFDGLSKFNTLSQIDEKIGKLLKANNFEECLKQLKKAFEIATSCKQYACWMAQCLFELERYDEAQVLIAKYPKEAYSIYLEGLIAFKHYDFELSVKRFDEASKLDPSLNAGEYKKLAEDLIVNPRLTHEEIRSKVGVSSPKCTIL